MGIIVNTMRNPLNSKDIKLDKNGLKLKLEIKSRSIGIEENFEANS